MAVITLIKRNLHAMTGAWDLILHAKLCSSQQQPVIPNVNGFGEICLIKNSFWERVQVPRLVRPIYLLAYLFRQRIWVRSCHASERGLGKRDKNVFYWMQHYRLQQPTGLRATHRSAAA